jgi:hypothetical protein
MYFNKTSYLNADDNPSKDAKSRARFTRTTCYIKFLSFDPFIVGQIPFLFCTIHFLLYIILMERGMGGARLGLNS